jgi:hypothetical protein
MNAGQAAVDVGTEVLLNVQALQLAGNDTVDAVLGCIE